MYDLSPAKHCKNCILLLTYSLPYLLVTYLLTTGEHCNVKKFLKLIKNKKKQKTWNVVFIM